MVAAAVTLRTVTRRDSFPIAELRGGDHDMRVPVVDQPEGMRAERSTGTRAEQRAGGLRGISVLMRGQT